MPVVKLVLEYDGTRYVGWQVQPNGPSIQAEVERALATLHKEPRRVTAAGRTDAGVHARGQVVSFPEARPLPLAAYVKGMNALLPDEVAVRAASVEPDGFDARRSARGKRYRYVLENLETRAPLSRLQAWQLFGALDVGAMREASRHLLGRQDFAAFQAADCACDHAVREVHRLDVLGEPSGRVELVVEATAFVKHMVRNFVGTLVEVGKGRRRAEDMPALVASRDRTRAGRTAPPQGLFLEEVFY
ncbi:tRNA pseudouridine(38-40) synthase TruA [Anaeromyxobacter sp. Fw109-5]|uniref:tRNA pseudouridine(38-40) synthase TruA n=1 Tax=Anaeromyxobacter sp. (strain Fw109-5) TaxID=404589 RepID=UPI000158A800|nr:tRNA pseudouridine(38-40) synthase TruA [Anaeromyxobacter sp. Fw109-5]ABS28369.1 tRNA pseudouridine synthase A [Anaeromyxobacter sp. Fw109-5]